MRVDYHVAVHHRENRGAPYSTIYENRSLKMKPTETGMPTCGVSMSGGSSLNYGEFKFEATVWCGIPASSSAEKDVKRAYDEAAAHVRRELAARMREASEVVDAVLSEMREGHNA